MTHDLTWLPAWQLAEKIATQEVTSVEVTQHFLDRIEKLEPLLHAFDIIDAPGALRQAALADDAVRAGGPLSPLHGVPTAVLNTFKVKGLPSRVWNTAKAEHETIGIERLRAAGMVLVGSTETYFFDPKCRPRNPWDVRMEPGNSSRGSAVAASAALLPITIGGDGAGSTRIPAAFSGVAGVFTSRGLIPHVDYEQPSLQLITSLGPMARSVRDCAIATQIMAGPDGRDLICIQDDPPDYLAHIDDGLAGLKLAWTDDFGWSREFAVEETHEVIATTRRVAESLTSMGAFLVELDEAWERHPVPGTRLAATAFGSVDTLPRNMLELVSKRALEIQSDEEAPKSLAPPTLTAEDYQAVAESRARNWERCRRVFGEHDVLLSATTPMVSRPVDDWGLYGVDRFPAYATHTEMFNMLGSPAMSVPCGFVNGLPVGLHVAVRPGREDLMFRVAQAIQQALPWDVRPPVS